MSQWCVIGNKSAHNFKSSFEGNDIFYKPLSVCNLSSSFYLKHELFSEFFRTRNTSRLSVVVEF